MTKCSYPGGVYELFVSNAKLAAVFAAALVVAQDQAQEHGQHLGSGTQGVPLGDFAHPPPPPVAVGDEILSLMEMPGGTGSTSLRGARRQQHVLTGLAVNRGRSEALSMLRPSGGAKTSISLWLRLRRPGAEQGDCLYHTDAMGRYEDTL